MVRFLAILALFWAGLGISQTFPKFKSHTGRVYATGLVIPENFKHLPVRSAAAFLKVGVPATYDLREHYTLSPVEDQGSCGSCWAFSTSTVYQDALAIKGVTRNQAEQYLLSCNTQNYNCERGGMWVYEMLMAPKGGVDQADMPYTATNGTCKQVKFHEQLAKAYEIPGGTNEIKAAIYQYGTVSIGVSASDAWSNYRGGLFTGCQKTGQYQMNHAVALVGWGVDQASGKEYWILKNSWGTGWGENGYMRIPINGTDGKPCDGVGSAAMYVVYDGGVNPDPTPDPGPNPPPDPGPGPTPDPGPNPPPPDCAPQPVADTGYGPSVEIKAGRVITIGTRARPGHTYYWGADPSFDNNAVPNTARISYRPRITKILTVHAVTQCGEATASTQVILKTSKKNKTIELVKPI